MVLLAAIALALADGLYVVSYLEGHATFAGLVLALAVEIPFAVLFIAHTSRART